MYTNNEKQNVKAGADIDTTLILGKSLYVLGPSRDPNRQEHKGESAPSKQGERLRRQRELELAE